jgi:hypothetical protein
VKSMYKYFFCLLLLFFFSCNRSTKPDRLLELNERATELNSSYKGKKLIYKSFDNYGDPTIVVYYDANCSVCFEQLTKWKGQIDYFVTIRSKINFRFILHTDNIQTLESSLKSIGFPLELVIIDEGNTFLNTYQFVSEKAFNSILLNKDDEILMIGSPLVSKNIKNHYTALLSAL